MHQYPRPPMVRRRRMPDIDASPTAVRWLYWGVGVFVVAAYGAMVWLDH